MTAARALVTGGAGFIGSHFVDRLLSEPATERVVVYDLLTYAGRKENLSQALSDRRASLTQGDVRDGAALSRLLKSERIDAVIHLAAETHVDRSILGARVFVETNVEGTYSVLEACKAAGTARMVYVSTDEVYGSAPSEAHFDEAAPMNPSSPYAATKAAADLLVQSFIKTHQMPAVIVRGANNYGPRQFPEKLIPFMVSRILAGGELPLYGDGQHRRDWIFVKDFCEGIILALTRGAVGAIYNLGAGQECSNREVVESLCKLLGYPAQRIASVADRPAHDRRYAMDCSRARAELGFAPAACFEKALAETVNWYQEHQQWARQVTGETATYFEKNYGKR